MMKRRKNLVQVDREIELIREKSLRRMYSQPRGF